MPEFVGDGEADPLRDLGIVVIDGGSDQACGVAEQSDLLKLGGFQGGVFVYVESRPAHQAEDVEGEGFDVISPVDLQGDLIDHALVSHSYKSSSSSCRISAASLMRSSLESSLRFRAYTVRTSSMGVMALMPVSNWAEKG